MWCWVAAKPVRWSPKSRASVGTTCRVIDADVNQGARAGLRPRTCATSTSSIDFTTPGARCWRNIDACHPRAQSHGRRHDRLVQGDGARAPAVEEAGTGFVWGANFSYGVNLFFQIVKAAAAGPAARLHRPHHRDPPHPQKRRAVGNRGSHAASLGAVDRGAHRDHFGA